ncbi:MAG TPA: hypothetical protein PKC40_00675 [Saprospiraceae bacterium]|nr:hypothetical protein [Saprospiraceae bacterium]
MRLFFLFSLILTTQFSFSQTRGLPDSLKTVILEAIEAESNAFYNRDIEKWRNTYLQRGDISWNCVEESGVVLEADSWAKLDTLVTGYMKTHSEPEKISIRRENIQFINAGRYVWVNFDEYQTIGKKTKHLKGVRLVARWGRNAWKVSAVHSAFVGWK